MKKICLFIVGIFSLFFISGCSHVDTLKEINYSDFAQKIQDRETFVIYFGSPNCSHCVEFRPTLDKVIQDHELEVYYLNMGSVSDGEYTAVMDKTGMRGTPTIAFVEEGVVNSDLLVGTKDYDSTVAFFKKIGQIK